MKFLHFFLFLFYTIIITACSTKYCGVDEEVFKTFSKNRQEEICKIYVQKNMELKKIIEKRRLIEEENRKKELELELKKVQCLYVKTQNQFDDSQIVKIEILNGKIKIGKRYYEIVPFSFSIARNEAKKVCLNFKSECFWIGYKDANIYINFVPDVYKKDFGKYVIENNLILSKNSIILTPNDWFRGEYKNIRFKNDKNHEVILKLFIVYD
ncbi:hypothetical protein [Nitrosophilus kaiyonis]|uniref:hypothetical protein n=1 Tax=Nitrosophilus kaiyonis TaxID=2930200 RepID=UPI0024932C36|nr:hypothetical protein [Nitrosophilus kaiyonis]